MDRAVGVVDRDPGMDEEVEQGVAAADRQSRDVESAVAGPGAGELDAVDEVRRRGARKVRDRQCPGSLARALVPILCEHGIEDPGQHGHGDCGHHGDADGHIGGSAPGHQELPQVQAIRTVGSAGSGSLAGDSSAAAMFPCRAG